MHRFEFSVADALSVRFALNPLTEALESVRTLRRPAAHGIHQPWVRRARAALATNGADVQALLSLLGGTGYAPDFLAPTGHEPDPSVDSQLAAVRATDPAQVERELRQAAAEPLMSAGGRRVAALLAEDPERALVQLSDQLTTYWNLTMAPVWPRVRAVCVTDSARSARSMGERGVRAALADLHPAFSWDGDTLVVKTRHAHTAELDGRGLVLVPSVFTWPRMSVVADPPWQPTIFYPPAGVGALWERRRRTPEPVRRLLGSRRADILAGLTIPETTTSLAARLTIAPATVSHHLAVLSETALVTATRVGREVFYIRSSLGEDILNRHE